MRLEKKICWRVTRACNLHCVHCLSGYKNMFIKDLDFNSQIIALNSIYDAGFTKITWTGGEPSLLPGFEELLDFSRCKGLVNVITTNGISMRDNMITKLNPVFDIIRLSFDGLEHTHNIVRGGNYFQRTLDSVDRFNQSSFRVEANITLTHESYQDIPELVNLLIGKGIKCIVFLDLINRESALSMDIKKLSDSQKKEMKKYIRNLMSISEDIDYRYNDYDDNDNYYIVVESDGEILLTSENKEDVSCGFAHEENAVANLLSAYNLQNKI